MKTRTGYLLKRGKTFYACWAVAGKKFRQSTHTANRKQAKIELARIMQPFLVEDEVRTLETVKARIEGAKTELAGYEEQRNPPLTIRQAWSAYVATPNRPDTGPLTLDQYEMKLGRFTSWMEREHPGTRAIRSVTEEQAEAYAADLTASKMTGATFNHHISFLKLTWRVLRKKAKLERNPWADIAMKRIVTNGRRELTIEELRAVCGAATGEMRTLFALGLYTGMRRGDCATLRWCEVDLVRGIIRRVPNKTARRNPKPVLVPIHPTLRAILDDAHDVPDRGDHVLPELAALYRDHRTILNKSLQKHFLACGIRTQSPGAGQRASCEVGFHSLRHSFVSLCRAANAPLSVVESLVGHNSPAMTRHYTHTGEAAAGAAVAALPDITGQLAIALLPDSGSASAPGAFSKASVRALAEKLTPKNAVAIRAKLLALTSDPA
jgi:integrase